MRVDGGGLVPLVNIRNKFVCEALRLFGRLVWLRSFPVAGRLVEFSRQSQGRRMKNVSQYIVC